MSLTLKNYTKHLTKEQLKAAEKCKVRECDETDQGVFVAYVDEGNDSFDVSLTISQGSEVRTSTCDCSNNTTLCRHKVALIAYIAKPKKAVQRPKTSKKVNAAETLLEQVEYAELKEWLKNLISKNSDNNAV